MRAFSRIGFASGLAACLAAGVDAAHIGQQTLRFTDEGRQRPVVVDVWYPTDDLPTDADRNLPGPFVRSVTVRNGTPSAGSRALILFSHGAGGNRLGMEWLAVELARQGHVAAAVDHWGNTFDNPLPEFFLRSWERPQDLSFTLTELLRHPAFGPVLDPERVGAIGLSLGGYTVLALAGAEMDLDALYPSSGTSDGKSESEMPELAQLRAFMQDPANRERIYASYRSAPPLYDARIRAVIALAPAIGPAFTNPAQCARVRAPVLIIGAEADTMAPVQTNSLHYHAMIPGSRHVLLSGEVGHFVFLNEAGTDMRRNAPALFVDHPSCSRRAIHEQVLQLTGDFLAEHLSSRGSTAALR